MSLDTLNRMTAELGADTTVMRGRQVEERKVAVEVWVGVGVPVCLYWYGCRAVGVSVYSGIRVSASRLRLHMEIVTSSTHTHTRAHTHTYMRAHTHTHTLTRSQIARLNRRRSCRKPRPSARKWRSRSQSSRITAQRSGLCTTSLRGRWEMRVPGTHNNQWVCGGGRVYSQERMD